MKPIPCSLDQPGQPQDISPRRKEKGEAAESERQRTRERLEATLAGLGELGYLRTRQELLVKTALSPGARVTGDTPTRAESNAPRSLEEKFLEDNILLLKKQLNCLRKRDAGLLSQLHELDKQINDLKIDVEKTTEESDSRPSSDDFLEWLDYREGQYESTGTVRRSFSAPQPNAVEVVADINPKYQCDLVSKNGNDVYRYPSPLHAVAVQSPMFLVSVISNMKVEGMEEDIGSNINDDSAVPELDPLKPEGSFHHQSNLCSVPLSSKKLDGYILSVIQKKAHPVRTNKPRTSVNADPGKGILRHGSMCVKQTGGVSHTSTAMKNPKQTCLHSSGITSVDNALTPSMKPCSKDSQNEQLESKRMPANPAYPPTNVNELQSQNISRNNVKSVCQGLGRGPVGVTSNVQKDINVPSVPTNLLSNASNSLCNGSPKENTHCTVPLPQEIKVVPPPKRISPKNTIISYHASSSFDERPPLDFKSEGSSSQSLDEGLLVSAHYIPAQQQGVKLHKTTKNGKDYEELHFKTQSQCAVCSRKYRKIAPRAKKAAHLPIETGVVGRTPGTVRSGNKPHGHAKDVVLAKPKHKRGDYRRWKLLAEISYEEALRRARRSQREMVGVYAQVPLPYASPYAYIASDSEYSAECESLFHSTVVDTSEDEQSNYTTNCFGDSESSLSEVEFVGESTTSSDTDESGGLIWSQFVHTLPMHTTTAAELKTTAKAFVKIKASHNLKKKILRFRSGSLKLMTTV
ncbi:LOW QUALITY PROTEIN: dapper homolog 1 [Rhinophrynus dorsalis]